jgi:hypothetical protein
MKINDKIKFLHISELTGKVIMLEGKIVGFGDAVRKKWPNECAEASDSTMLVQRADAFGNVSYFAISQSDVISGTFYVIDAKGKDKKTAPEG